MICPEILLLIQNVFSLSLYPSPFNISAMMTACRIRVSEISFFKLPVCDSPMILVFPHVTTSVYINGCVECRRGIKNTTITTDKQNHVTPEISTRGCVRKPTESIPIICSPLWACASSLVPSVLHLSHGFHYSPTLNRQPYEGRLPLTSWWRKSSNMTVGQSSPIRLTHHCYDWHPGSPCGWTCNQLTSKVDAGITGSQLRWSILT